ncbi:Transcription factor IIA alpha/beta subunit [Penicillium verhagenii]|uniref:Transcription factor IIA alpha/beta subunit n=1 Tax=Penicillium verhagenii TaxID=1562060 RepID=UPI0025458C00|nr:Transcription factor IIA alpha/beta subunit [Penicillium verhagenii]KAJ5948099.1 Transcription factor IIA alpha/beta subunit [Penicillium verhagenii]
MSNQQVGPVFERVIQEVCDASQVDFEESGVDQKTLVDLRETWQHKLSSVNVAHFPWDPTPQPTPQAPVLPPQTTVPSNAPRPPPQQQQQQQHAAPHIPLQHTAPPPAPAPLPVHAQAPVGPMAGPPRIKTEPGTNGPPGLPNMNNPMQVPVNSQAARDRAISAMQQKYGANAAGSVQQMHQMQAQAPGQQQYQQMHNPNPQMPQIKQESNYPSMGPSQTDGGGDDPMADWKAEVARRREAAANGHGDHMLREHFKSQMRGMEGGGLFRPLSEHESPSVLARRAAIDAHLNYQESKSATPRIRGQVDGEEADEDAINSDLDDPEDQLAEDADADESEGQVMLCTYDKVQRVKNKWKCTLKDGILTSGGREYVFHKGQGEFEW